MKKLIACAAALILCLYSAVTVYGLSDGNKYHQPPAAVEVEHFSFEALAKGADVEEVGVYLNDNSFLKPKDTVIADGNHWSYSDRSCSINIDKIWYGESNVFVAHLTFSDYSRFRTVLSGGTAATVSSDYGALLVVNNDVATGTGYVTIRDGNVVIDGNLSTVATYSRNDGRLRGGDYNGQSASDLAASGAVTDTFQFGPEFLVNGSVIAGDAGGRAQRTFIGTNGNAGDIVIGVSSGRYVDGVSQGLTYRECAEILQNYGCTFGAPLDGGGSSTMIFRGTVLVGSQRGGLQDFILFK